MEIDNDPYLIPPLKNISGGGNVCVNVTHGNR
jgi:hypothetical protein